MAILFTRNPLERMKLIQPFGVNYLGGDFYSKIGIPSGRHTGWDMSCLSGTPLYAVADGWCEAEKESGYGVNARLFIDTAPDVQLEVVYGHMQEVTKTGNVKAGDQIGLSDNTGYSTGAHLHWGIRTRVRQGSGWQVSNYDNGYFGYLDPALFFPKTVFELPVDRQYGNNEYTEGVPSWLKFQTTNAWFYWTFKRLMTTREMKAFRFGFHDLRTVLDPALFVVWSEWTKPEAIQRKLLKKI